MVQISRRWRLRAPKGGFRNNYKLAALAALAVIGAGSTFGLATGQIAVSPNSFLAAVFSFISPKPNIQVARDVSSATGATANGTSQQLAAFQIQASNVTNWATLRGMDFEIDIEDGLASSPLSLSNFVVAYSYCVPLGKTYGYGYKGGSCSSRSSANTSSSYPIQVYSVERTKEGNGYIVHTSFAQPVYPQQTPGVVTVSATPKYGTTASASYVSKLRVAVIGGSASGDQCSKYDSSISSWAYSGCSGRQTFVSVPAYGNTVSVSRSGGQPAVSLKPAFISASTMVTAGPAANDDKGTFKIQYSIMAVGGTAYVSANPSEKNFIAIERAGLPVTAGVSKLIETSGSAPNAAGLYEIPSGTTRTFTAVATVQLPAAGAAGLYGMMLDEIHWTPDAKDSTPDLVTRLGRDVFKTNYLSLN